jgi:hypothetical protein
MGSGKYTRTVTYPTNYGPKNFVRSVLIVWMHDRMGMSFLSISRLFDLSAVAIFMNYHRWYNMAHGFGYEPPLCAPKSADRSLRKRLS